MTSHCTEILVGLISAIMFRSARTALTRHNGVMTWDYSQSAWSTFSVTFREPAGRWGICKALSAQWIVDHAYGGSLFNRITNGRGDVDPSAIRMIQQNFAIASGNQADETKDFLIKRGVLERRGSLCFSVTRSVRREGQRVEITNNSYGERNLSESGSNGNVAIALAAALKNVSNCYAQIGFGPTAGTGHAVAAWVGGPSYGSGGDVAFFDPNFGEVWFAKKADFFEWFEYFYRASYAGFPCKFNGRWDVSQWALSNTAAKGAYAKAVLSVAGPR